MGRMIVFLCVVGAVVCVQSVVDVAQPEVDAVIAGRQLTDPGAAALEMRARTRALSLLSWCLWSIPVATGVLLWSDGVRRGFARFVRAPERKPRF